ncbi:hypothetical protein N0V84_007792 [Fusarium piperis]|uniref:Uncharacterized protein n=1 Tax=Fusarium piperis TaxID=1435070 RepID=A0A9W8W9B2_9HYPO|nr:hypothetical protein N0V84_007792 [Fusarium piperis]
MKSSSTITLLALLASGLAGAATEPSNCATTKTLPAITLYSCPGDSEQTKTVFAPGLSPTSAPEPGAPGPPSSPGAPGAPGESGAPEEPNTPEHCGSPQNPHQPNSHESSGSDSNPGSGSNVDNPESSATVPVLVPGRPETPSVVAVAGAPKFHLDLLLLKVAGFAGVAMVWL